MAYVNSFNGGNGASMRNGGYQNRSNTNYNAPAPIERTVAIRLPDNYVDAAEQAILSISGNGPRSAITTSKLRSLFGLFSDLYTEIKRTGAAKLTQDQVHTLLSARVRIVYEIGRDKKNNYDTPVGIFAKKTKILEYLLDVGDDAEKLKNYYNYFEALVAYHRFYFGEV